MLKLLEVVNFLGHIQKSLWTVCDKCIVYYIIAAQTGYLYKVFSLESLRTIASLKPVNCGKILNCAREAAEIRGPTRVLSINTVALSWG